ncbi:hypothetical protein OGAPHI_000147 [Ogataea philodendri]|uniref:D-lactate dehydrogenase (cytochrome) n=1 Tax=Ogataea philodendri TaxID=1378263 RepID=A0A9P8TBB0_9ASCO|nr:uncharacterized protein OGAPHI_000147 [Ogataea philodendri]KAH3671961.1 hypothetical protein OGAPHI_000147 [Ogataea philodendri]
MFRNCTRLSARARDCFYMSRRSLSQGSGGSSRSPSLFALLATCVFSASAGYAGHYYTKSQDFASTTSLDSLKSPTYASSKSVAEAIDKIRQIVGPDSITTSPGEIDYHSKDPSNFVRPKPDEHPNCVVYPTSVEQVSEILKICHEYSVPVIPFSGGTSIEGHYIPTRQGVSLDLGRMNKILRLHEEDLDVVVQPGVDWMELNEYLSPYGLMFGPDPGPGAMIGGILATNASGTNAVKYGAAKDNVLSLTVVLADGTIVKTKNRPRKSSNGYNLTNLFIGSEGTLGVIVEATLKLHFKPQNEVIATINFKEIGNATKTVTDLFRMGISCNAVEFMDDKQMRAVCEMGAGSSDDWAPDHMLLLKVGATSKESLKELVASINSVAKKNHGFNIGIASDEEDKERIWTVRKTLLWNSLQWARKVKPNATILPTDVCVPVSRLPELITRTMTKLEAADLLATAAGHAGDGNLHVLVIFDPEQKKVAHELINEMSKLAIELEGTVSGEHGIGVSDKRELLVEELGVDTIDLMRSIKYALDKKAILNPDHIFKIDPSENRNPSDD